MRCRADNFTIAIQAVSSLVRRRRYVAAPQVYRTRHLFLKSLIKTLPRSVSHRMNACANAVCKYEYVCIENTYYTLTFLSILFYSIPSNRCFKKISRVDTHVDMSL